MKRIYLKGLIPLILILMVMNLDPSTMGFKWSWWTVYLVISYAWFFPTVYRHWSQSDYKEIDMTNKNPVQEARRANISSENTGSFGTDAGGRSNGKDKLSDWGIDVVLRFGAIFLGIAGYAWLKLRPKKK